MTAGRVSTSKNKDWCTPKKYADIIKLFFDGNIDLDPCSNNDSIIDAKKRLCLPIYDGLKESWNYHNIYVNPPYGKDKQSKTTIKNWICKCCDANINFDSNVLALIPVATNTSHWKQYVFGKASAICFLYDTRLKFLIDGTTNNKGAPMACCFVYWGNYIQKFNTTFKPFGEVVRLTNKKWKVSSKIYKEKHD